MELFRYASSGKTLIIASEDFMNATPLLNGFFGDGKPVSAFGEREARSAPDASAAYVALPEPEPVHPDAILMREEIIDVHNRLCGYRFMPKTLAENRPFPESWFYEALHKEHIAEFAQQRMAVVPLTADGMFFGRHHQVEAPHVYYLIAARHAGVSRSELLRRLTALHEGGFLIALSGITLLHEDEALLQAADLVFLNLAEYLLPHLETTVRDIRLHFPMVELAAESVHSWAEQRMCLAWGFKYCLGDFLLTQDDADEDGGLNDCQKASMQILNMLRHGAELPELVEIAKKDPALTFHLLKWANSPANRLTHPVTSVSQAIHALGRAQIYRWLTVALFRMGGKRERNESLLELALARARCMETLVADRLSADEREELFLVGLLSLFDALLRMPMEKVVAQMRLSVEAADVLLRSTGPYAPYLKLTIDMEKGRVKHVTQLADRLGIALETLEPTRSAAYLWAQNALGAHLVD